MQLTAIFCRPPTTRSSDPLGEVDHPVLRVLVLFRGLPAVVDDLERLDAGLREGVQNVLGGLVEGRVKLDNAIAEVMNRRVSTVSPNDPASSIGAGFNRGEVALVVEGGKLLAILTKIDLIDYLTKRDPEKVVKAAVS